MVSGKPCLMHHSRPGEMRSFTLSMFASVILSPVMTVDAPRATAPHEEVQAEWAYQTLTPATAWRYGARGPRGKEKHMTRMALALASLLLLGGALPTAARVFHVKSGDSIQAAVDQ